MDEAFHTDPTHRWLDWRIHQLAWRQSDRWCDGLGVQWTCPMWLGTWASSLKVTPFKSCRSPSSSWGPERACTSCSCNMYPFSDTWAVFKIPLSFHDTGWSTGIPLLYWIIIIPNVLGSIIPYKHQPTGVLNTAHMSLPLFTYLIHFRTRKFLPRKPVIRR